MPYKVVREERYLPDGVTDEDRHDHRVAESTILPSGYQTIWLDEKAVNIEIYGRFITIHTPIQNEPVEPVEIGDEIQISILEEHVHNYVFLDNFPLKSFTWPKQFNQQKDKTMILWHSPNVKTDCWSLVWESE